MNSPLRIVIRGIEKENIFKLMTKKLLEQQLNYRSKKHFTQDSVPKAIFAYDYIANQIQIDGIYERQELIALFEFLAPFKDRFMKGIALDIGANIGNHTRYFFDRFSKVHAFEPAKEIFQILVFNTHKFSNIETHNFALGGAEKKARIFVSNLNIGGTRIVSEEVNDIFSEEVEVKKLDGLRLDFSSLKFMKIDVEGYEFEVLSGALHTISKLRPIIIIEQWPNDFKNGSSPSIDLLKELGYDFFWKMNYSTSLSKTVRIISKIYQIFTNKQKWFFVNSSFIPSDYYPMLVAIHVDDLQLLKYS
jgi:FkbM family methyltransferase